MLRLARLQPRVSSEEPPVGGLTPTEIDRRIERLNNRPSRIKPRVGLVSASSIPSIFVNLICAVAAGAILFGDVALNMKPHAIAGTVAVLFAACALFRLNLKACHTDALRTVETRARSWFYVALIAVVLLSERIISEVIGETQWRVAASPTMVAALTLAMIYGRRFAFDVLVFVAVLIGIAAYVRNALGMPALAPVEVMLPIAAGAGVAMMRTFSADTSTGLPMCGLFAGVAAAVIQIGLVLVDRQPGDLTAWTELGTTAGLTAAWGLVSGTATVLVVSFVEWSLGFVTDFRLVRLLRADHPLLRQMQIDAPGTLAHSNNVARLAEEAAAAIGANALLARVGGLFHDIGKLERPRYFTENNPNSNQLHDRLAPAVSAAVIINHVSDGIALARAHKLPRALDDFIYGHHGTSLVRFFYMRAQAQAKERGEDPERVDESKFRYPGPKPQSREAAVVAIADHCEATMRSQYDGTQTRSYVVRLVHSVIREKIADGQFDECGITLHDLNVVRDSVIRTLGPMYAPRIRYPSDQKPANTTIKDAAAEKEAHRRRRADTRRPQAAAAQRSQDTQNRPLPPKEKVFTQ